MLLGETFAADLFTGTGHLSLPLSLPPGRGGFQPELTLEYSTGQGNGVFGLGWALTLPGVSRKTSRGVPKYGEVATGTRSSAAEQTGSTHAAFHRDGGPATTWTSALSGVS